MQSAVILAAARAARPLFARLAQPAVVGEMAAGLLIGPSCLGYFLPRVEAALFPPDSLAPLNALSQTGLVLFMYIIGIRTRSHASEIGRGAAAVTSVVSIVVPFAFGVALSIPFHERLAPPAVGRLPFGLFIGAAMSITAFPVLARILTERGLLATRVGAIAIACAAFDDLSGWLILAAILTLIGVGSSLALSTRVAGLVAFAAIAWLIVRPALARLARRGSLDHVAVRATALLVFAFLSAAATQALGVHALFGAFFAGVATPPAVRPAALVDALEPFATKVLLPLFFAFTGLRTAVGAIDTPALWWMTAAILVAAIAGKGAASTLAARAMGLAWRDAAALGALMNTRGLVELVVLNVGLDAGVLSPIAFSMLVVMALTTTMMTCPLLNIIQPAASTSPSLAAPRG